MVMHVCSLVFARLPAGSTAAVTRRGCWTRVGGTRNLGLETAQAQAPTTSKALCTVPCTTKQWWCYSGSTSRHRRKTRWQQGNASAAELIANTDATLHTFSLAVLHVTLAFRLQHLVGMVAFNMEPRCLRLGLQAHIQQKHALDSLCKRIASSGSYSGRRKNTVVAYGDGQFSSVSRGHAPGPVVALRKRLQNHCHV